MSDTSSIASLLTQTITANARSSANAKVEIVTLPPNLQNLEQAQNLRGQIVQIDQSGTVTIRTDQGQVVIRSDQAVRLENGAPIEIRIDAGNPPTQAALRPAPETPQQAPSQTTLPQVALPQTLSFADITNGTALEIIPYNIEQGLNQPFIQPLENRLSPLTPINITLSELGSITAGKPSAEAFILSLNAPFITPTGEAELTLPPLGPQTTVPFRNIAAQIISAPLQEPVTSTDIPRVSQLSTIQIENIIPPIPSITPGNGEEFVLLNTRIGSTHAILEGFTQNRNFAVFRITAPDGLADQHYALQVPVEDIPVGSKVSLNILQTTQSTASALPALTASYFLTPSLWPVFQEIEQSLMQANTQAVQVFNAVLPNAAAPAQMGTTVMFFVAAMRAGDIQGWLGDKAVDAIKRAGKSDLLGRLGRELSGLARMNADTISGDWRALSLPLAWQNDIHKIALYYRREDDGQNADDQSAGNKTRFIMDLNLSNMGKVQLDGLFTGNPETAGRLDLVLRTEQSFTQAMKQDMRSAYKSALEETQITGELSFQDHLDSWVRITPDAVKEYDKDV